MPSMLDQRPPRRSSPLFGRALIEQQKSEEQAQQDAIKNQRDQERDQETRRHNRQVEELDRLRTETALIRAQAATDAETQKLKTQKDQAEAFVRAQSAIGKLKPNDPQLSEKIAQIQGENNILFDGQGTSFGQHLGTQVADLFKRREAIQNANTAIAEKYPGVAPVVDPATGVLDAGAMAKAHVEAQHQAMTAAGLVPKSGKDPVTGIEYGQPAKDASTLTAHDKADLAWKAYSEATKLRAKFKDDPKTGKPPKEVQDTVNALDAQRTSAMQTLSQLGINMAPKSPISNEHPVPPVSNYDPNAAQPVAPASANDPVARSGELQDQPKLMDITPDLYLSAQSAITAGKDPAAVKQRLIESGYSPSGLDNGPSNPVQ